MKNECILKIVEFGQSTATAIEFCDKYLITGGAMFFLIVLGLFIGGGIVSLIFSK